jgi:fibronectin-binding autotransporter adhesin
MPSRPTHRARPTHRDCFARLVVAAMLGWCGSAPAAGVIRITEVMSSSGGGGTNDWFEVTNYGTTAVDVTGWRMDDGSFNFGASLLLQPYTTGPGPAWTLLEPGESAVMLEVTTLTPADQVVPFQAFWSLGTAAGDVRNPKIATYAGSGVSFSSGGDGVVVFDSTGAEVTPQTRFGAATGGSTFFWAYDALGDLATSATGTVSVPGIAEAYTTSSTPANIGSPGIAVVETPSSTLFWAANGTTLGGAGNWTAAGGNWSPSNTAVSGGAWADGSTAVFGGAAGTVAVNAGVAPLGLTFAANGFTLAAGSGSVTTATIQVDPGFTATVGTTLTGDTGLALIGAGTLVLTGTANAYTGFTSVADGLLRAGASEVIPDASRLTVSRFMTADLAGYDETVNGIAGLGTITLGKSLTVSITGDSDVVLDGFLRGAGDLIVDSPGAGGQRLDASTQTINDGAVKDYTGRTIVQRGTLKVHYDGIPTQTSGVVVKPAGVLRLETSGQTYSFAQNPALPIELEGGTLGQGTGDDVELLNAVNVTANSTLSILNSVSPDPLNPTTEELTLAGPLTGIVGTTLTISTSNTIPGADKGRVEFTSLVGNTYAGTVRPQVNAVARFNGDYLGVAVALDQGMLEGFGSIGAVRGTGRVSPEGDLGPGILTAADVTVSATTGFEFDFNTANAEPVWFSPTASENDVLRLTAATGLPVALGAGNDVRLFLNVASLSASDTFTGGFFTTADSTAAISSGRYDTYVYGDGLGADLRKNDVGWYSLASWNTKQGTALSPGISMVATNALFDGSTPTAGYVMQARYAPTSDIVIDVASGTVTQAQAGHAQIAVADSVTKTGAGTVIFNAVNSYTGPTTVAAGTLQVANAAGLATSSVTVDTGATLAVASDVTMRTPAVLVDGGTVLATALAVNPTTGIAALVINAGTLAGSPIVSVGSGGLVSLAQDARVMVAVGSLAVAETTGGGRVDVGGGELAIAAGGASAAELRADIVAGRNGGAWNGSTGITSSTAAAVGGTRAVGYVVAGDGSARVSFAAPGDVNINGQVDVFDLVAVNSGGAYGTGTASVWNQGDFNYDGVTNVFDLVSINTAGAYGQGNYFPAAPSVSGSGTAAAVPEPVTPGLAALILAGAFAARRRFRRTAR